MDRRRLHCDGGVAAKERLEVLLVVEHEGLAAACKLLLEYLDCRVRVCETPAQALRAALARLPQLVIVDVDCAPTTVAEQLTGVPAIHDTLFVALGSFVDAAVQESCAAFGYQLRIPKPILREVPCQFDCSGDALP